MSPALLRGPARKLPALFCLTLLSTLAAASLASAQAIGANRGDIGATGATQVIQGHVISPTGKLPDTRIRITLNSTNGGTRQTTADDDGNFTFSGIEGGPYDLLIDAGKDYETARESVYVEAGHPIYNVPVYLRLKPEANPALAGVPKAALDLFQKALEAERKGENDKAMSLLSEAIAQYPQFGLAHGELGMLYYRAGKIDQALEEMKVAEKAVPDDPQVQMNYGMVLVEKKDYAEAEKQLRRAAKRLDKSAQLHTLLGVAVMRQRGTDPATAEAKLAEAEKEFQQSIKLGGDPAGRAHYYLGGIYWSRHENKKAAQELELYLKQSPNAPDAQQVRDTIKKLRG
ncbi:MAG: tetratricopeptide repeat protein [Acidobacteriota bacterium]|nr:tetratricopeptide repeat protein [Acidobacteriota bacterium]MDQ5836752.1 tetratricopeptide repeat protein [Acidobacteriota bacterium]